MKTPRRKVIAWLVFRDNCYHYYGKCMATGQPCRIDRCPIWRELDVVPTMNTTTTDTTDNRDFLTVDEYTCREPPDQDLSKCPRCAGPADNGHTREVPPSPYLCTKCTSAVGGEWKGEEM